MVGVRLRVLPQSGCPYFIQIANAAKGFAGCSAMPRWLWSPPIGPGQINRDKAEQEGGKHA
jgi:hypothetical protein